MLTKVILLALLAISLTLASPIALKDNDSQVGSKGSLRSTVFDWWHNAKDIAREQKNDWDVRMKEAKQKIAEIKKKMQETVKEQQTKWQVKMVERKQNIKGDKKKVSRKKVDEKVPKQIDEAVKEQVKDVKEEIVHKIKLKSEPVEI